MPLVFAQGAGRVSAGTTIFGGMIAATIVNLVFIPVLYVIVRSIVPGATSRAAAAHEVRSHVNLGMPGFFTLFSPATPLTEAAAVKLHYSPNRFPVATRQEP